jgi:hypothetical protein
MMILPAIVTTERCAVQQLSTDGAASAAPVNAFAALLEDGPVLDVASLQVQSPIPLSTVETPRPDNAPAPFASTVGPSSQAGLHPSILLYERGFGGVRNAQAPELLKELKVPRVVDSITGPVLQAGEPQSIQQDALMPGAPPAIEKEEVSAKIARTSLPAFAPLVVGDPVAAPTFSLPQRSSPAETIPPCDVCPTDQTRPVSVEVQAVQTVGTADAAFSDSRADTRPVLQQETPATADLRPVEEKAGPEQIKPPGPVFLLARSGPAIGDSAPTPVSLQRSSRRLFAFSELGMFGRNGAQVTPLPKQVREPEAAIATDVLASVSAPVCESPILRQGAPPTVAAPSVEEEAGLAPGAGAKPALLPRAESILEGPAVAELPLNAPRGEEAEPFSLGSRSAVTRANVPAPLPRSAEPVSVVVSGPDQALTIVARVSDAEPAQIRRLIEASAAEFDATVAEFQLNGAATEPSFSPVIGGNHGTRSR